MITLNSIYCVLFMVLLAGLSDYLLLYFFSASPDILLYIFGIGLQVVILPGAVDQVFPSTS